MTENWPVRAHIENGRMRLLMAEYEEDPFDQPFFGEGLRVVRREYRELSRTNSLRDETLPLSGVVWHVSRCGSTLLCRMLQALPEVRVISEPLALNDLLMEHLFRPFPAPVLKSYLDELFFSFGKKTGKHRRMVLKPSSWNMLVPGAMEYFQTIPALGLYRNPSRVLVSYRDQPDGLASWGQLPGDYLLKHFPGFRSNLSQETWLPELLALHYEALMNEKITPWNFAGDAEALLDKTLSLFNLPITPEERSNALARSSRHSKRPQRPFIKKGTEEIPINHKRLQAAWEQLEARAVNCSISPDCADN